MFRTPSVHNHMRATIAGLLRDRNLESLSVGSLRQEVESALGMPPGGLDEDRQVFKSITREEVQKALATRDTASKPPAASGQPPSKRVLSSLPAASSPQGVVQETGLSPGEKKFMYDSSGNPMIAKCDSRGNVTYDKLGSRSNSRGNPKGSQSPSSVTRKAFETPAKKPKKPTAYNIFYKQNFSRFRDDLFQTEGKDPHIGIVHKKVAEAWAKLSDEEKRCYEPDHSGVSCQTRPSAQPAISTITRSVMEKMHTQVVATGGPMTKKAFLQSGKQLRFTINDLDRVSGNTSEGKSLSEAVIMAPRSFSSGALGWCNINNMKISIGDKDVDVRAQVTLSVCGSRTWFDDDHTMAAIDQTHRDEGQTSQQRDTLRQQGPPVKKAKVEEGMGYKPNEVVILDGPVPELPKAKDALCPPSADDGVFQEVASVDPGESTTQQHMVDTQSLQHAAQEEEITPRLRTDETCQAAIRQLLCDEKRLGMATEAAEDRMIMEEHAAVVIEEEAQVSASEEITIKANLAEADTEGAKFGDEGEATLKDEAARNVIAAKEATAKPAKEGMVQAEEAADTKAAKEVRMKAIEETKATKPEETTCEA